MQTRPERAKALSSGQRPEEQAYPNPIALKEQKKHTLTVPFAPVGQYPLHPLYPGRCPALNSRLGFQPASTKRHRHTR